MIENPQFNPDTNMSSRDIGHNSAGQVYTRNPFTHLFSNVFGFGRSNRIAEYNAIRAGMPTTEVERWQSEQDEQRRLEEREDSIRQSEIDREDMLINMSKEREDNAIQRKVLDAQRAGLSPLAALGGHASVNLGSGRQAASSRRHDRVAGADDDNSILRMLLPLLAGMVIRGGRRR